jgi:hypothetical protein
MNPFTFDIDKALTSTYEPDHVVLNSSGCEH